jgi:hypothetical protein
MITIQPNSGSPAPEVFPWHGALGLPPAPSAQKTATAFRPMHTIRQITLELERYFPQVEPRTRAGQLSVRTIRFISIDRLSPAALRASICRVKSVVPGIVSEQSGVFKDRDAFGVEAGVSNVETGDSIVEAGVSSVEAGVSSVEAGVSSVEAGVSSVEAGVSSVEAGVSSVEAVHRKTTGGMKKCWTG